MVPAETMEVIQESHGLFQFDGLSVAPVVAMPAMEVAGLSDVPLERKKRNGKIALVYFRFGRKSRAIASDFRGGRKNQSLCDRPLNCRIDGIDRDIAN